MKSREIVLDRSLKLGYDPIPLVYGHVVLLGLSAPSVSVPLVGIGPYLRSKSLIEHLPDGGIIGVDSDPAVDLGKMTCRIGGEVLQPQDKGIIVQIFYIV